jgi:hypothetical protein
MPSGSVITPREAQDASYTMHINSSSKRLSQTTVLNAIAHRLRFSNDAAILIQQMRQPVLIFYQVRGMLANGDLLQTQTLVVVVHFLQETLFRCSNASDLSFQAQDDDEE